MLRESRWFQWFLVGVFGCHVALVVAGAAHFTSKADGSLGQALRFYTALTGSGDSYSFFAPSVGPQVRARFVLSSSQGEPHEETLETGKSREVGFRLGNIAGTIYLAAKRTDLQRVFLAALAANRFDVHPEASQVQVNIEEWEMPTMADYRAGSRSRWRVMKEATFTRNAIREASHDL